MIISERLKKELEELEKYILKMKYNTSVTNAQIETFLRCLEKHRYNILTEVKMYNKIIENKIDRISNISDEYKIIANDKVLKIYIPECLPSFKNQKSHAHRSILLNLIRITQPYTKMFEKQKIFIIIKVFDKISAWDIDNKDIKPISDALVQNRILEDDTFDKMFYLVKGEYSEIPHTEIYITNQENTLKIIEEIFGENVFFLCHNKK